MPHITIYHSIEYITSNLNKELLSLHKSIAENTGIDIAHIKSRSIPYTYGVIAENTEAQYLHVEILLKNDKTQEIKEKIAELTINFLKESFDMQNIDEITLEIREFEDANYFKYQNKD